MAARDDLIAIEERGWEALATSAEAATAFYGEVLDDEVAMRFPGGMAIDDRDAVLASMGGDPWSSYELSDVVVLTPTADTGIVTYRSTSQRGDADPYTALITSVYVRRGAGWRLVLHQHTPV